MDYSWTSVSVWMYAQYTRLVSVNVGCLSETAPVDGQHPGVVRKAGITVCLGRALWEFLVRHRWASIINIKQWRLIGGRGGGGGGGADCFISVCLCVYTGCI